MKKLIFFLIFFASAFSGLIASNYNPGFGQEEPCHQYWWPDLPWTGPEYKIVVIDGCSYLIAVHTRVTPYGRKEFQITEFARLFSNGCVSNHSFDEIKRNGYLELFRDPRFNERLADTLVPMVIQENVCRKVFPTVANPNGNVLDPFTTDTLFITIPLGKITPSDSLTISSFTPAPIGGLYTLHIDRLYLFCPDTVCCRAHYNVYFDNSEHLKRVIYDPLPLDTYLGGDTCRGSFCEENCGSLNWNYDYDTVGGFFKSTSEIIFEDDKNFNLYPNPVEKELTLELTDEETGNLEITISDISGVRIVYETFAKKEESFIKIYNFSNIISGSYFIDVKINNKKYKRKFQVK